jgi:hypothetical protein
MMSAGQEVMHAAQHQWGQQYTGEGPSAARRAATGFR